MSESLGLAAWFINQQISMDFTRAGPQDGGSRSGSLPDHALNMQQFAALRLVRICAYQQ